MYNPNLKLNEIFESNTLRNIQTASRNAPMPHSGKTYYVWDTLSEDDTLLKEILNKGNKWSYTEKGSINSYIDLTDKAHELISSRLIQYGPNSNSSSFTVRIVSNGDSVRVTANGWGSSVIELYDGDKKYFLNYLLDHQKRGE